MKEKYYNYFITETKILKKKLVKFNSNKVNKPSQIIEMYFAPRPVGTGEETLAAHEAFGFARLCL